MGGGGIIKISSMSPSEYKPSFPIPYAFCGSWVSTSASKNLLSISCLVNFKKILIVKLCLPLGNLVFRVSLLPNTRSGKMRHPGKEGGRWVF